MPKRITPRMLKLAGACSDQVDIFRKQWPRGTAVTIESVEMAVSLGLDIEWAARKLLSDAARAEYARATAAARAEYARVRRAAWAELDRAIAPALAEYKRAIAPALAEYRRAIAPALAEYWRATAAARAEYDRVRATACGMVRRRITRSARIASRCGTSATADTGTMNARRSGGCTTRLTGGVRTRRNCSYGLSGSSGGAERPFRSGWQTAQMDCPATGTLAERG